MLILRYAGALVMMILCLAPAAFAGPPANQTQPYILESTFTRKRIE